MTQEQIVEGNKLIAQFMGVKIGVEMYSWRPGCQEPLREEHLNYHEAWGWLLPVWKRLRDHPFGDCYGDDFIWYNSACLAILSVDIKKAYLHIVEGIKVYNQQTKTNDPEPGK